MPVITKTKRVICSAFSLGILFYTQVASATITVPLRSKKGMVVSANGLASQVGVSILQQFSCI
jgi:gamma-glutamyltranspeptidase/glutathione hydrolase